MANLAVKLALLASMTITGTASAAAAAAGDTVRRSYIVQLHDAPLASRAGPARRQAAELEAQQRAVLALVPQAPVQYRYTTTLNGFAILLTQQEAATLRAHPGVKQVTPDRQEQLQNGGAKTKLAPEQ